MRPFQTNNNKLYIDLIFKSGFDYFVWQIKFIAKLINSEMILMDRYFQVI